MGVFPENCEIEVEWPKGQSSGTASVHRELFDTIGREMSKAILGQTTTMEASPNGDRASTETRDKVRGDILEADCRAVAATLRAHLFAPAVAVNLGDDVRCPVPWFQTEESADQKEFAEAIRNLQDAGLRIPAKWVRDEIGMPEPLDGEEVLEPPTKVSAQVPGAPSDEDEDLDIPVDVEGDEEEEKDKALRTKAADDDLPTAGADNGLDYADRLTASTSVDGARALAPSLAAVLTEIAKAEGYEDALRRVEERYGELANPMELKVLVEADLILAQLAGAAAVREDTPERCVLCASETLTVSSSPLIRSR